MKGLLDPEEAQRWEDAELQATLLKMEDVVFCPRCNEPNIEVSASASGPCVRLETYAHCGFEWVQSLTYDITVQLFAPTDWLDRHCKNPGVYMFDCVLCRILTTVRYVPSATLPSAPFARCSVPFFKTSQ